MPFSVTPPPVKKGYRKACGLSCTPKYKIIFPLFMRKAHAARIQNRPRYIRIRCAARAMEASSATRHFSSIWPQ